MGKRESAFAGSTEPCRAALDPTEQLVQIARATLHDLGQQGVDTRALSLDSTLDRDLGLDSLARVELFTRIEHELHAHLPVALFATAETLRDIAVALGHAPVTAPAIASRVEAESTLGLAAAPPRSITTLDRVLRWHRELHPHLTQITICGDGDDELISYDRLWRDAQQIAGGLQALGVSAGDTVALMLPTSRDYFGAFAGALLAGAVPVPLYPPTRLGQIEEHVRRHAGILTNAQAGVLITTPEMRRLAAVLRAHAPSLRHLTTADELRSRREAPTPVAINERAAALLQYTSGSTGQPKGVVLSHANILANIAALGRALDVRSGDVFVSWLPLYHDMGLIGAWLGTLYFGLPLVVMSPLAFLSRPTRWLEAIHRYRGTLSAAPNFAYELCLKRSSDDELQNLDLSTWRIAMNGAEAVMPGTLERFAARFARCGLSRTAMTPVYGLAECSVGLTVPPLERGPLIDAIERESFVQQGIAIPVPASSANALRFASCGRPLQRHEVRIVDDAGRSVGERREGRLELRGPSTTQGYYRNPEATAKLLRDGWLDSGDRAYVANGEVYVTGRIKDIIIRAGRHIYPDELEAAIGNVAGIRKGCVAAFGSIDRVTGTERVIVLAETAVAEAAQRETLRRAITAAVIEAIGEPPDEIALAAPHTVLKTSSGKLRRSANRELYESGTYRAAPQQRAAWVQLWRVGASAAGAVLARTLRRALQILYGGYLWGLFGLLGSALYLIALLPLAPRTLWFFGHRLARLFVRLAGIPLTFTGAEPLREDADAAAGQIIVANHSSYLDALLLMAVLPRWCHFVGKHELARLPIVGRLLRRLGTVFVDRLDVRAGVEDVRRIADLALRGESCILFPEGTFVRTPGLLSFHLGAFAAAVRAGRAIVPVALRGTRALLRDQQWLPRRTPVSVHIAQPIPPPHARNEFVAAIELRDAARRSIVEHCGEPDLAR